MKKLHSLLCLLIVPVFIISLAVPFTAKADQNNGAMNLDIMFICDASGSMNTSDEKSLGREAVQLMLNLCDASSCRAGVVLFSHEEAYSEEHHYGLCELGKNNNLSSLQHYVANQMQKYPSTNDTNLKLGLDKALEYYNADKGDTEGRHPVFILVTDGCTDLGDDELSAQSDKALEEETIPAYYEAGIPVYTLCLYPENSYLGADRLAKAKELMVKLSQETGGQNLEVKSAGEIPGFFKEIFAINNNVKQSPIDISSQSDSRLSASFSITNSSVASSNIIIKSTNTDDLSLNLYYDDYPVSLGTSKAVLYSDAGSYYTIIKLKEPSDGDYLITFNKPAEVKDDESRLSEMECSVINTYSTYVNLLVNGNPIIAPGESVSFDSSLMQGDELVDDEQLLVNAKCTFYVCNEADDYTTSFEAHADEEINALFHKPLTFNKPGEYQVYSVIGSDDTFLKKSETITVSVVNNFSGTSASQKIVRAEDSTDVSEGALYCGQKVNIQLISDDISSSVISASIDSFSASCTVKNSLTGKEEPIDLTFNEECFAGEYTLSDIADYTFSSVLTYVNSEGQSEQAEAEPITVSVKPNPLEAKKNSSAVTMCKGLFVPETENSSSVLLSNYLKWDTSSENCLKIKCTSAGNGDVFTASSPEFKNGDYVISFNANGVGESSAEYEITDTRNNSAAKVTIDVNVTNGAEYTRKMILKILLALILFIVIVSMIVLTIRKKTKPYFNGQEFTITIKSVDKTADRPDEHFSFGIGRDHIRFSELIKLDGTENSDHWQTYFNNFANRIGIKSNNLSTVSFSINRKKNIIVTLEKDADGKSPYAFDDDTKKEMTFTDKVTLNLQRTDVEIILTLTNSKQQGEKKTGNYSDLSI